jgi:uncharacterized membrane protein
MEARAIWIVMTLETLVAAGFMLIIPLITRRGLLFGAYVGEEQSDGEEARRITRGWYAWMVGTLVLTLLLGTILATSVPRKPELAVSTIFVFLGGTVVCYLRAYYQACALTATMSVPSAAAPLLADTPASLTLPLAALGLGLVVGAIVVGYTWIHYPDLPARMPTHFGPSGAPDAWSPKSFASVMLLPLGTLFMGVMLGVVSCLTARAKRAIRQQDGGVSIDAQIRFRRAMARFLSGTTVLVTLMLGLMSIWAVRTALGRATGMPPVLMVLVIGMVVYAFGGSIYIAIRYGQGGARLERRAGRAALTDGLADNERWILGAFYVNRDDPSVFVEKRFGLGYTINLGNPKAILLLVVLFGILAAILIVSLTMPQMGAR